MLYTKLTRKAMQLCFAAHKDQVDRSEVPYVFHPYEVACGVGDDEYAICVALLHDVLEDTDITEAELRALFPTEVVDALCLLNHDKAVPYMDYVRAIAKNPLAAKVKRSDLRHNSTISRLENPTEKDFARVEKYKQAMALLDDLT